LRPLEGDAAFDFIADRQGRSRQSVQEPPLGVENQPQRRALDVQRMAVVAMLAAIGNQGIRLLLALPQGLQIGQGPFHLVQVCGHPSHLCLGSFCKLGLLRYSAAPGHELCFTLCHPVAFALQALLQFAVTDLGSRRFDRGGFHLAANRLYLSERFLVLLLEQGVQGLAAFFPFGLAAGACVLVLGGQAGRRLFCLEAGHHFGAAVDHQQQQDQRPHGAQEHRQEGERRNLQPLPPPFHDALSTQYSVPSTQSHPSRRCPGPPGAGRPGLNVWHQVGGQQVDRGG
jgi:hypothetical protein